MMFQKISRNTKGLAVLAFALVLASCSDVKRDPGLEYAPQMYVSVPYNPDQPNPAFKNGMTAQQPVAGTVPIGHEPLSYPNTTAGYELAGKELVSPLSATKENFDEGKRLYLAMCSHCHGKTGMADGMVVKNGSFPAPPAYNSPQLKNLPEGKMFFSITYGKNAMGPQGSIVNATERWQIIQYIQYLQKQ